MAEQKKNLEKLKELQNKNNESIPHKLSHSFKWPLAYELTLEEAREFMLIKGVAMSEGPLKSKEVMKAENVIAGGGAMRAAALMGVADIDIDHIKEKLPEEYEQRFGKEINDTYPPAFIIDAQTVQNEMKDGTKLQQVEYIGACINPHVYQMVKDHKFKGNSVEDYVRNLNCSENNAACEYEGSAFMMNTLILLEVPNSDATWVDIVDENDIGSVIVSEKSENVQHKAPNGIQKRLQQHINTIRHAQETEGESLLESYMTDGIWEHGRDSISAYLMEAKGIDEKTANEMAKYLWENPSALSQYQLEYLSTEDLTAWWNTFHQFEALNSEIHKIKKNLATLAWLEHNAEALTAYRKVKLAVQYGQGEVNYGESEPDMLCQTCRWFSPTDLDDIAGEGMCVIVSGDVQGRMGCDKHDQNPTAPDPTEEQPPAEGEPGEEPPAEGEPPMEEPDEVAPDENGNCPDGYMLSEDGTVCVRTMKTEENGAEGKQSERVPEHVTHSRKQKLQHHGISEKQPSNLNDKQDKELDTQIAKLKSQIASHSVVYSGRRGAQQQAQLESLRKELKRLEDLKKN